MKSAIRNSRVLVIVSGDQIMNKPQFGSALLQAPAEISKLEYFLIRAKM